MDYLTDCRYFTGYKPCQFKRSCKECPHYDKPRQRICVVSLEAMGAVLRSTCLLPAIKRKFPSSHVTWVTLKMSRPLLENNPLIDRIVTLGPESAALLSYLEFDYLYGVDKSLEAGALSETIRAENKYGFGLTPLGVIRPFNEKASYQYDLGLDDELKFFKNQKAETEQLTATMGLEWVRDEYVFEFSPQEKNEIEELRKKWVPAGAKGVIGYNTGCSLLFPYKKFTVATGVEMIRLWRKAFPSHSVLLFGGPEDTDRQAEMKSHFLEDDYVVNTPTTLGLRNGIKLMNLADTVLSGCSLGMHIAIALKKHVTAWFGVSCIQEVDLYDRGHKLASKVNCSPCWKKSCNQEVKCFERVDLEEIVESTRLQLESLGKL